MTAFSFCNYTFAQTDECKIGTDSAKADYSRGILRTYIFGAKNSRTFGKLLMEEYGIDAVYWGCLISERWDCYSKFMNEKIKMKFGNDIFEKVAQKSQRNDSLGKGDRQSAFPGGETELMKFIYCNLDLTKAKYSVYNTGEVTLQFAIDTTGRPVDIRVTKPSNKYYNSEAIRLINLMPDFTTATENGRAIKQKNYLTILFNHHWKTIHCP